MAIGEGRGYFKAFVSGAACCQWCDHGVGRLLAWATIRADADIVPYRYPTGCARGPSRIAAGGRDGCAHGLRLLRGGMWLPGIHLARGQGGRSKGRG